MSSSSRRDLSSKPGENDSSMLNARTDDPANTAHMSKANRADTDHIRAKQPIIGHELQWTDHPRQHKQPSTGNRSPSPPPFRQPRGLSVLNGRNGWKNSPSNGAVNSKRPRADEDAGLGDASPLKRAKLSDHRSGSASNLRREIRESTLPGINVFGARKVPSSSQDQITIDLTTPPPEPESRATRPQQMDAILSNGRHAQAHYPQGNGFWPFSGFNMARKDGSSLPKESAMKRLLAFRRDSPRPSTKPTDSNASLNGSHKKSNGTSADPIVFDSDSDTDRRRSSKNNFRRASPNPSVSKDSNNGSALPKQQAAKGMTTTNGSSVPNSGAAVINFRRESPKLAVGSPRATTHYGSHATAAENADSSHEVTNNVGVFKSPTAGAQIVSVQPENGQLKNPYQRTNNEVTEPIFDHHKASQAQRSRTHASREAYRTIEETAEPFVHDRPSADELRVAQERERIEQCIRALLNEQGLEIERDQLAPLTTRLRVVLEGPGTTKEKLQALRDIRAVVDEMAKTSRYEKQPQTDGKNALQEGGTRHRDGLVTPTSVEAASEPRALEFPSRVADHVADVVNRYCAELRSDNEYWIRTWLRQARSSFDSMPRRDRDEPTSVFQRLKPIQIDRAEKPDASSTSVRFSAEVFGHRSNKSSWIAPCRMYREPETRDVSNYAHYVSISKSLLAPNETILQHWPYAGDDVASENELRRQHYFDMEHRERKLNRLLQAEHFAPYVDDILAHVGCSWSDVLRFFLEVEPDVGSDPETIKALRNRAASCKEDFKRSHDRWRTVLSRLPPAQPGNVGKAALLCAQFLKCAKFSFWHLVRRSAYTSKMLAEHEQETPDNDDLTCRVCLRFSCPYHGEILEEQGDRDSPSAEQEHAVETDIVQPYNVNHRERVPFPPSLTEGDESNYNKDRRSVRYWQNNNFKHKVGERGPFYPCHHPGLSCETAECSCYRERVPCEKTCGCPSNCHRRFPGCTCSSMVDRVKRGRTVCFKDERCLCFQLERECDPDLCGNCGVCDVLDPLHRHDDRIVHGRCQNAGIQRGVPKHTILGESGVHGLGLYACEDISEYDYVGEYKGEIVTKDEAERRGAVYELQKLTYLFTLNEEQEIDSTYFGNKIRFINHASKNFNLYPRIVMVNTVHRIALYADQNIKSGEELLFNYGPAFHKDMLGHKKAKKSIAYPGDMEPTAKKSTPHVRNAGLTQQFYEVEQSEDEVGIKRARKVSGHTDKSSSRPGRPKGKQSVRSDRSPAKVTRDSRQHDSDVEEDAEARLQYYVSEDGPSDPMDLESQANIGADDPDDEFEPEEDDDSASAASVQDSEREVDSSDVNDDDEDDDDNVHVPRRFAWLRKR